jgi:preprotein translocase SecE subunit
MVSKIKQLKIYSTESKKELSKVIFPTKLEVQKALNYVLIVVAAISTYLFFVDTTLSITVKTILN